MMFKDQVKRIIAVFSMLSGSFMGQAPPGPISSPEISVKSGFGVRIATEFPGVDIGAKIIAAFASCANRCMVYIPAGIYVYRTTIVFPVTSLGQSCLSGAGAATVLDYTGSGDAIAAFGNGSADASVCMRDFQIKGSPAGTTGIHLRTFQLGHFSNIFISNFAAGEAILNEGANTCFFYGVTLRSNRNGVHQRAVENFTPNANSFFGGEISSTHWGFYEESNANGAGGKNTFSSVVFQSNGNAGVGGHVFLQGGASDAFESSYFEYDSKAWGAQSILIGDASHSVQGTSIRDNLFIAAPNTSHTINIINGSYTTIDGNQEGGAPTGTFLGRGTGESKTILGQNSAGPAGSVPFGLIASGIHSGGVAPGANSKISIPGAVLTGIAGFDPLDSLWVTQEFTRIPSPISSSVLVPGKPWRAIFQGIWSNNQDGGGMAQLPPLIEVTSTSPTVVVGASVITFSVDPGGFFQGAASRGIVGFIGTVQVIPNPFSPAGSESARFKDKITAATFLSTVPTGAPPLIVASATNVPKLNASSLNGAVFAAPGPIGSALPSSVAATTLNVVSRVLNDGAGLKHVRVVTGMIPAGQRVEVMVSWPGKPFSDTKYTTVCEVNEERTAAITQGLVKERIRTLSALRLGVEVFNPTPNALGGTVSCIAMHD